jgi:thiamine-phosphate diphosphorylase / hydroxyethylthiazole kinase
MADRADRLKSIDWSLYLVTDSTPAILGNKKLADIVDQAIRGGVGIVQYREKYADTRVMIETASKLHAITQKHSVPLLINDRVDVCLAIGAEGVHLGQDDMNAAEARKILGPSAIIGVTAASPTEAQHAIKDGADYLGIGTTFATPTKIDTKHIIGTQGLQSILAGSDTGTEKSIPCVAIGSINRTNVQRVLHQSAAGGNRLNGIALVSAIIASSDPFRSAQNLYDLIKSTSSKFYASTSHSSPLISDPTTLLSKISQIVKSHADTKPLCHNMTNTVVQNFVANACLATGSSPIMSANTGEAADLARLGGSLVINMGTASAEKIESFIAGVKAYNEVGAPVVFDPVGAGATAFRRDNVKRLLAAGFFSVIKGNESEILAVEAAGACSSPSTNNTSTTTTTSQQRGVDSGPSTSTSHDKALLVRTLACRENNIILLTGKTDYLSDGHRTYAITNGSHYLSLITGSGCALGAVIASYLAVYKEDKLLAVLAGVLHYEIASEMASLHTKGPGTFIPAFLDALYEIRHDTASLLDGRGSRFEREGKVKLIDI